MHTQNRKSAHVAIKTNPLASTAPVFSEGGATFFSCLSLERLFPPTMTEMVERAFEIFCLLIVKTRNCSTPLIYFYQVFYIATHLAH